MRRAFELEEVAAAILQEHWFGRVVSIVVGVTQAGEVASKPPYDTSSPSHGPKGRNSPMLRPLVANRCAIVQELDHLLTAGQRLWEDRCVATDARC